MLAGEPARADARRNVQRILDATSEMIAADPGVSMKRIAARAGVSRATIYHHFPSRDALMDRLTDRSVSEVAGALEAARSEEGGATEAIRRMLAAAWQVIGRYRGLVIVNQRLDGADLRARLEPALAPLRAVIRRGQEDQEFDAELTTEWLLGVLVELIHAAARQVSAGTMSSEAAERALLRSASAMLASPRSGGGKQH